MKDAATRPLRRYVIQSDLRYSLRDAAHVCDLPVDQLRRSILLDEIDAEPVDDGREYLLQGRTLENHVRALRPQERPRFEGTGELVGVIGIFLAVPLVALLLLLAAVQGLPAQAPAPALAPAPAPGSDDPVLSPPEGQIDQRRSPHGRVPPRPRDGVKGPMDWKRGGFPGW